MKSFLAQADTGVPTWTIIFGVVLLGIAYGIRVMSARLAMGSRTKSSCFICGCKVHAAAERCSECGSSTDPDDYS